MKQIKLLLILPLMLCILFSFGCENNEFTYDDALAIFNTIETPKYIYEGEKLELPTVINNQTITYSSSDVTYINNNLEVIKSDPTSHKAVNINVLIGTHNFTKKVSIHQNIDKYFEKVMNYFGDKIPSGNYNNDISFLYSYPGDKDLTVTYTSNKPNIVTNDGKRIEHDFDEEVVITVTINKLGKTYTKDYTFESRGMPYSERYAIALDYINDYMENLEIKEGAKLPTKHPIHGGRIRWICEDPTVVYDYETIHLPKEAKTAFLLAEVRFGSTENHILKYQVNLPKRDASITDFDYAKTFIETTLKNVCDFTTLYDGTKANINQEYIVDKDVKDTKYSYFYDLVRNDKNEVIRKAVPQEKLDVLMYPGYTMPNEQNILWIVVHETGMSQAGDDALKLAKAQYNTAYVNGGREASWAYTVDDSSIYQSFPDTYMLWHATDGSSLGGGNYNGIGIEMCVNSDGEYEVSLRNNARLMGGLLEKYNLGMMNMKQHYQFYSAKSCPEKIIRDLRWYEYLTLVSREYISQTILSQFNITYNTTFTETLVDGIYETANLKSGESIDIEVTINEETFIVTSTKN